MEYIYMEANEHHSGNVRWIVHKTKKGAINSAKIGIKSCGLKTARVYAVKGIEVLGWYLKTDLEPRIQNIEKWKLIAEYKEEVEQ